MKINSGNIASAFGSLEPYFSSVGEVGRVGDIGKVGDIGNFGVIWILGGLDDVGEGGKGIDAGDMSVGDATHEFWLGAVVL